MHALLAMIKANLKMTTRNRQAIFWNLAFPILFIVIFGTVFSQDTGVNFHVGVVGADSSLKSATIEAMKSNDAFTVDTSGTPDQELQKLKDGDRDIVVDFEQPSGSSQPTVQLSYDQTQGPN